jgi:hypothetical protein
MGVFFVTIGLVIVAAQKFNFLGDSTLPFIMALFWALCALLREICIKIGNETGIWVVPLVRKRNMAFVEPGDKTVPVWDKDYQATVHETIDNKYINDEIVQLEHFRHSFVKHNRPWIVQQLRGLLKHDILLRHNTVFKKTLELLSRMLAMDDPLTSDSESSEVDLELFGITKDIAMMWIIQSRRRLYLKKLAKPVIKLMQQKKCNMCGMQNKTLRVCFSEPLDGIIDVYEMANVGKLLVDSQWQRYIKNTTVASQTLCLPCSRNIDQVRQFTVNRVAVTMAREWLSIYRTKKSDRKRLNIRSQNENVDISEDSESDARVLRVDGEPMAVHLQTKQILNAWLTMCSIAPIPESEEDVETPSDDSDHSMM